jgi:hypothetical protein
MLASMAGSMLRSLRAPHRSIAKASTRLPAMAGAARRPDGCEAHQQVVCHQGDGQVHDHEDGEAVGLTGLFRSRPPSLGGRARPA